MSNFSKHNLSDFPDVLSVKQVGQVIHVCDKTVYKLIHNEDLFALRVGKIFRIPKHAVLSYIRDFSEFSDA